MTGKPRFKPAAYVLLGSFPFSIGQLAAAPLDLQQQVVTATRTAQTAQQSLAAVTVIDRERIERSQASSLPELLKQVPGVSLANNGGPGKSTSLFMRGTEWLKEALAQASDWYDDAVDVIQAKIDEYMEAEKAQGGFSGALATAVDWVGDDLFDLW